MNSEMPNLQPVQPDKKFKLPEKSATELEAENYGEYLIEALHEKGEVALAELVASGKLNVELLKRKAISTGEVAENFAAKQGKDFLVEEHLKMRAGLDAEEIIANRDSYLQ